MIRLGILNPAVASLVRRVRHTNTLVIADRGFPAWPAVETIDLSLVDDIPTVPQVLDAILDNFDVGAAWMAEEFLESNAEAVRDSFTKSLGPIDVAYEPHTSFKTRVPDAIGLIRTGDTTQYANIILESA